MEEDFDVIVFGTGLTESIVAAAIAKAGFKVAHVDPNPYYGANEASLSLSELAQWVDNRSSAVASSESGPSTARSSIFTFASRTASIPPRPHQYSVSLSPTVIPSVGPLISSLISSGVARYGGFSLLGRVAIYDDQQLKAVPGSKEDVFKDKSINLIDKRRLMRFLMFTMGDFEESKELAGNENEPFLGFLKTTFSLSQESARAVSYALAFCISEEDPTLPALHRIRSYLKSSGRYGSSPFLVGHYGGLGEMAQGFCRMSAVHGGVYILGRSITRISHEPQESPSEQSASPRHRYTVELDDLPEPLHCDFIISSSEHVPDELRSEAQFTFPSTNNAGSRGIRSIARCIAIIDKPIITDPKPPSSESSTPASDEPDSDVVPSSDGKKEVGSSILIFPPGSTEDGSSSTSVHVLVTGPGSMSTPAGKWIAHISMPLFSDAEELPERLLEPYVKAILSLTSEPSHQPIFVTYYSQHDPVFDDRGASSHSKPSTVLVTPPLYNHIADSSDTAARTAEAVFWKAIETLKAVKQTSSGSTLDSEATFPEVENFWPPLDVSGDEEGAEEW